MTQVNVTREDGPDTGRYVARIEGKAAEATLRYRRPAAGVIEAISTQAPDELRGTGAAMALVQRLIHDARAAGDRIIATCPYVKLQFERHPEWADLRAA